MQSSNIIMDVSQMLKEVLIAVEFNNLWRSSKKKLISQKFIANTITHLLAQMLYIIFNDYSGGEVETVIQLQIWVKWYCS